MKSVKGAGFGVRFYRRAGVRSVVGRDGPRDSAKKADVDSLTVEDVFAAATSHVANTAEDIDALEQAMRRDTQDVSATQHMEIRTVMTDIPPQTDKVVFAPASPAPDTSVPEQAVPAEEKAAMRRKKAEEVKKLMAQKTGPGTKELALWGAAKTGNCPRIRLLVLEGVDLDARDAHGRTAFNIATQYNQQAAVKTLLAAREMRRMATLGELPKTRFYSRFAKTGTDSF